MRKAKPTPTKDNSPVVPQRDKISYSLGIQLRFELTEKQKEFISLVSDKKTKIVLVKGPAGSAKTFLAIYSAVLALNERRIGEILYLRNPVESSSYNLGFLPGEAGSKIEPYLMPLTDKLKELLPSSDISKLKKEERIKGNTIGFMRGASINASYVVLDEIQNFSRHDFLLTMTRIGKFSKFIFCGDTRQSDIGNSGFRETYDLFDNDESKENGIFTFKFGKEDIVREPVISYILDKFEELLVINKKGK